MLAARFLWDQGNQARVNAIALRPTDVIRKKLRVQILGFALYFEQEFKLHQTRPVASSWLPIIGQPNLGL
jgi:hypothetical protein